jgi:hypothetical protein
MHPQHENPINDVSDWAKKHIASQKSAAGVEAGTAAPTS